MATITTQSRPTATRGAYRSRGNRGQGGNRNRGRKASVDKSTPEKSNLEKEPKNTEVVNNPVTDINDGESAEGDSDLCWICAEPVKYYAVSECNHRTCHVCALRLRALYKNTDCTFCKAPQTSVIFTVSGDAEFSSYTPESIPHKDAKLAISFETQEMMEDTLILLRFNCPDEDCDYIGNGWGDLKLHTRAVHNKLMCDICVRFKKVFAHEHALYPPNVLPIHLPSMHQRPHQKQIPKDQIEGGIHPLCEFCRECFFSNDEHYTHMRQNHEECFICKRNEIRDQYFMNYDSLERHFNNAHHPCMQPQCLARKFVVFNTLLDLQAHMVEEHGGDMTSRDKKDARRIQAEFAFEEVNRGGRGGRRDRGDREREREPPPLRQPQQPQPQPTSDGPPRPPGNGNRRREAFGGSLTVEGGPSSTPVNNNTPHQSRPPSPPRGDIDAATAERHASFMARLQSLSANPTTAVSAVKAATRGYRASESSSRDLISTIWNVLDRNLEHTASIVNAFVDLLDDEEKKQDLLASWKGFMIEQRRQFPDLVPTSFGEGYAGITSGRVLNAKHSTAIRSSQKSSRQIWDRVAQVAASSSSSSSSNPRLGLSTRTPDVFPVLATPSPSYPSAPAFHKGQRNTPWSASAAGFRPAPSPPSGVFTVSEFRGPAKPQSGTSSSQVPPKLSSALFPELPSASAKMKAPVSGNSSLKNIIGSSTAPSVSAWQVGASTPPSSRQDAEEPTPAQSVSTEPKGKKGRGKQKQTLFTLGSFPA